jgi:hypothetical protein
MSFFSEEYRKAFKQLFGIKSDQIGNTSLHYPSGFRTTNGGESTKPIQVHQPTAVTNIGDEEE